MPTNWKINGQTFASLFLKNLRIEFGNQDLDKASFTASGRGIDQPLLWQTGDDVVITKNDTPYFSGKIKAPHWDGRAAGEDQHYEVLNWMDQAARSMYCQPRTNYHITIGSAPIANTTTLTPNLFFGVDPITLQPLTLAQEITAILNYLKAAGVALQIGTIEPAQNLPYDSDKSLTCKQALQRRLRWAPLMSLFTDYSTTPPTVHCRQMSSLTPISLPIGVDAGGNSTYIEAAITKRDDLKVKGVAIYYFVSYTYNGTGYLNIITDVAGAVPVDGNGAPTNPGAPDTLCQAIDLQGGSVSTVSATIRTMAVPNPATDTQWLAFYKQLFPDLNDPNIQSVVYVSGSGTRTTSIADFPNILTAGQIAAWMLGTVNGSPNIPITAAADVFTARFQITYKDATGAGFMQNAKGILKSINVIVTNAPANLAPLTITSAPTIVNGEVAPAGVAAFLFAALSTVCYQGQVTHTANLADGFECPGTARPGKLLQLANGAPEWATMTGALIQRVTEDIDQGKTAITFGPPPHLSARDFISLFEAARNRQLVAQYQLGGYNAGANLVLGNNTPILAPSTIGEAGKVREILSDGTTTIDKNIADLVAGTKASFQDIAYVSAVTWDGTNLKQTLTKARVLTAPPVVQPATIIDTPNLGCT